MLRLLITIFFVFFLVVITEAQTITTLNVSISSSTLTSFRFRRISDYNNGIVQNAATTIQVTATLPWHINFHADNNNFTSTSSTVMPLSVLSLAKTGQTLKALTNNTTLGTLTQIATGAIGNANVAGNTFTIDYKANPGYLYNDGSYSVGVVYTISAL